MIKVLTKHNKADYVKAELLKYYIAIGYVVAVL
jgi:hypothetical protein